jgi:hypothetical protein
LPPDPLNDLATWVKNSVELPYDIGRDVLDDLSTDAYGMALDVNQALASVVLHCKVTFTNSPPTLPNSLTTSFAPNFPASWLTFQQKAKENSRVPPLVQTPQPDIYALLVDKKAVEALAVIDKRVSQDPLNAELHWYRAIALALLNRQDQGRLAMEHAVSLQSSIQERMAPYLNAMGLR